MLLEDHMNKCEKSGKFVEAELAKQRIIQLKKVEEDKIICEMKIKHEDYLQQLEASQKEELDRFNELWDKDFYDMNNKFTMQDDNLKAEQQRELEVKIEEFNNSYHENPKPTSELLNLNKMLEQLVKIKE